jgi:hypothetical protein
MSKNEKTKSELEKELQEIEALEAKIKSKKDGVKFSKLDVPFKVGNAYFIRTVTYFATGKVKAVVGNFLVLEDAAWIADTGRFSTAMTKGILDEIEPVDVDMYINLNSIADAFDWKFKLPREVK